MSGPRSLQGRLGLWLGLALMLVWIAAASVTALLARQEMEEVFDAALQEMAQRVLPLAVVDVLGREEEGVSQRLAAISDHDEFLTYIVRDDQGSLLLQSHAADPAMFPGWDGTGFRQTATHRLYNDAAVQGTVRITMAEPLAHRAKIARELQIGLGLPLRQFRDRLAARGVRDLSRVANHDLPAEIVPVAETMNGLLSRLSAAFDAERSFAANAAHELRTPLAGAIAQAQRLQAETPDPGAKARAADIEATLKRLTRLSERLMQLARAEGGRLRLEQAADLRPVARLVAEDLAGTVGQGRIALDLPCRPVLSDLDPDAFAILLRNLVENVLRHGTAGAAVEVSLSGEGVLSVANEGPVVLQDTLARLTQRFERGETQGEGSGLGLAIVAAIASRSGGRLERLSPRQGRPSGFEARFTFPRDGATAWL